MIVVGTKLGGNPDHAGRRGGLLFQRVHHFISNG
jgi:hypothetical protein